MELKKIQSRLYKMLVQLNKICKENEINYYLIGGSTLGAVRHNGFIPWDDDIDIGLFRKDFEKLENILSNSKLKGLKYCKIGENIIQNAPIGYLYDMTDSTLEIEDVPTIDIFPIDGVPQSKVLRKIQKYSSLIYHLSVSQLIAKNRGKFFRILSSIVLEITPKFIFKFYKIIFKKIIINWNGESIEYCANIFGQARYEKEIMPKSYFGTPKYLKFEDSYFPVPELTHEYLTHLYGDYMKLPKEEERRPKHKKDLKEEKR